MILASAEKNDNGFWIIDTVCSEITHKNNKYILEIHRKELIGEKASQDILFAINLNLENIINNLKKEGFSLDIPPLGIPFNMPLDTLENIFDFWFEIYKNTSAWETCLGLLKIKQRFSLDSLIISKSIKGKAKEWAPIIEKLHCYRPIALTQNKRNEPMWK